MRKRKEDPDELEPFKPIDDEPEELSEKELKKIKNKESADKRKTAKKKDRVARWGGIILLGLVMFVGFLLWVSGEMKDANTSNSVSKELIVPVTRQGTVIVK